MHADANTPTEVFGFGWTGTQEDESRELILIEDDNSVVFYFTGLSAKTITVQRVTLADRQTMWAKAIVSIEYPFTMPGTALARDASASAIYLSTTYLNTHVLVCKLQESDGESTYCAKINGDGYDAVLKMAVHGNSLHLLAYSDSS